MKTALVHAIDEAQQVATILYMKAIAKSRFQLKTSSR
jgi:hypothetical protein